MTIALVSNGLCFNPIDATSVLAQQSLQPVLVADNLTLDTANDIVNYYGN